MYIFAVFCLISFNASFQFYLPKFDLFRVNALEAEWNSAVQ